MLKELFIRSITGLCFAGTIVGSLVLLSPLSFALLLLGIATCIICIELPRIASVSSLKYWILVIFYVLLPFSGIVVCNYHATGRLYVIALFLIAFVHDTTALIAGKLCGNHKLIAHISPGKTWEGLMGGFLGIFIFLLICNNYFLLYPPGIPTVFISVLLTFSATTGDLFESWLKRCAHLKDTSSLLPGHGGFLDRFDSIIALSATMIFTLLAKYFYMNNF